MYDLLHASCYMLIDIIVTEHGAHRRQRDTNYKEVLLPQVAAWLFQQTWLAVVLTSLSTGLGDIA